ncbi:PqqD family protein [Aurantiacibacter poecillastricola]|uniref:PqqD family protein n=1 Tax=Aurantiacibacter poecillastricola TaxID=3064385 RepID=UPI00273D9D12|nr:PqqD family protein [Aurantiacibacter sp. 219JJ12-13]MDP5263057.1 PqqD family protein [Aurantiacibacter sp. 219JJ12-13]
MNATTKLVRNPEILSTEVGESLVMMSMETGNYHELDSIGTTIWDELETPKSLDELCDSLCGEYDVTPGQCREDIEPFLQQMKGHGLVSEV